MSIGLHHMIHVALIDLVVNKYSGISEEISKRGLKDTHLLRTLTYRKDYLELLFAIDTIYRSLSPRELIGEFFYSEEINQ